MTASPPDDGKPAVARAAMPVLLAITVISWVGFGMVAPLLPFYGALFDVPAWEVTLLFSAHSAGQFAGELYWGRLSDRIGRRPVLLMTITGMGLCFLGLAFAPNIWLAVLVRMVGGFFAGNISTVQSYVVDISPPERVSSRLGQLGAANVVGFSSGPALGGLLANPEIGAAGFRPPLLTGACLSFIAVICVFLLVRESFRHSPATAKKRGPFDGLVESMRHPMLRSLMGVGILFSICFIAAWATLGLWGAPRHGWDARTLGIIMGVGGLTGAFCQAVLVGPLVRRLGAGRTIILGLAMMTVFLIAMAFAPWTWLAAAFLCLAIAGNALVIPATATFVITVSTPERQGQNLGASNASMALARVGGPMIGGMLFAAAPVAPFIAAALGMLPAIWLTRRAMREGVDRNPR